LAEKCSCPTGTTASSDLRRCLGRGERLNDPCIEHVQCSAVSNSVCNATVGGGTCQCRNGFVNRGDNTACAVVLTDINSRCEYNPQCSAGLGEFAECREGFCRCTYTNAHYQGKCYIPARLGEQCLVAEQCYLRVNKGSHCGLVNSTSTVRSCQCLPEAKEFDSQCYIIRKLGEECESNTECSVSIPGNRVHCDVNTKSCVCNQGYTADDSKMKCNTGSALIFHSFYSIVLPCVVALFLNQAFRFV